MNGGEPVKIKDEKEGGWLTFSKESVRYDEPDDPYQSEKQGSYEICEDATSFQDELEEQENTIIAFIPIGHHYKNTGEPVEDYHIATFVKKDGWYEVTRIVN
jgi:hypothetical protein